VTKIIEVIVPLKGISLGQRSTTIETSGFVGEGCKTVTAALESALGTVTEDAPKQELYETESGVERLSENGG